MGARTPKDRGLVLTCNKCQASFSTTRALRSHCLAKHTITKESEGITDKVEQKVDKDEKKTALVTPTARSSKRLMLRNKSGEEDSSTPKPKSRLQQVLEGRKSNFQCPKCSKLFPVYFSALKHIQKLHSDNLEGGDNSTDPVDLKPVQVEICTTCDKQVIGNIHKCGEDKTSSTIEDGMYSCLGCDKKFPTVTTFAQHVSGSHTESVESMVFKDNSEFLQWKSTMESHVRFKYLTLGNCKNSQYYQCNYVSPLNSAKMTHLCPSIVTVSQMRYGMQINYHKKHHNHSCQEYSTPKPHDKSKANQSTDDAFDCLLKNSDSDVYTKFKNIMKNVTDRYTKVSMTTIKKLYNLAQDMKTMIDVDAKEAEIAREKNRINSLDDNNTECYIQENSDPLNMSELAKNESLTDEQISKVLESPRVSARLKRKSEPSTPNTVKKKENCCQ